MPIKVFATILLGIAIIHTFLTPQFKKLSRIFKKKTFVNVFFHYFGEVELVFGFWSVVLIFAWSAAEGVKSALSFLNTVHYTEAVFIFVILCITATKPIVCLCKKLITAVARLFPGSRPVNFYCVVLTFGPLLGSLITEPAAMTVSAILLKDFLFDRKEISEKFKYFTLALLFVNISIGGTLTHFAAPPILMVAKTWGWNLGYTFLTFGPKVIPVIIISTVCTALIFRNELRKLDFYEIPTTKTLSPPIQIIFGHLFFLVMTVYFSHDVYLLIALFLAFSVFYFFTRSWQEPLRLKQSLLVAAFLAGLVTLGTPQDWWIQPAILGQKSSALFLGAIGLTAVTDNAALTFLASLVEGLSQSAKYMLVAGAVAGGGLTIIANAPNPAGFAILKSTFGEQGISHFRLFLFALPYTLLAGLVFYVF